MSRKRTEMVPARKAGFIGKRWRLLFDPSIPLFNRLVLFVGSWYFIIPEPTDIIPIVGWVDDISISGFFFILVWRKAQLYQKRRVVRVDK